MSKLPSFQRFTAVLLVISFAAALASNILQGLPLKFSEAVFSNPGIMLKVEADGARLLGWGLTLDMLGYYLALLPAAIFLHKWLEPKNPAWVRFFTVCGLGYILLGAAGAAMLASALPPLVSAYGAAAPAQQPGLQSIFTTLWAMVYGGLWNLLGELLAAAWFLGIGWGLSAERKYFILLSTIVGVAALLDSLGTITSFEPFTAPGLLIFLALAPVWALWLGINLLRQPVALEGE